MPATHRCYPTWPTSYPQDHWKPSNILISNTEVGKRGNNRNMPLTGTGADKKREWIAFHKRGIQNERVFPAPVAAHPMTSFPAYNMRVILTCIQQGCFLNFCWTRLQILQECAAMCFRVLRVTLEWHFITKSSKWITSKQICWVFFEGWQMISEMTESIKHQPLYHLVGCAHWVWSCLFCSCLYISYITLSTRVKQPSKWYEMLVLGAWTWSRPILVPLNHFQSTVPTT